MTFTKIVSDTLAEQRTLPVMSRALDFNFATETTGFQNIENIFFATCLVLCIIVKKLNLSLLDVFKKTKSSEYYNHDFY